MNRCLVVLAVLAANGGFGCEKDPQKTEAAASAKPAASATTPPAPPPPRPPTIAVDDVALTVNGERAEFAGPDAPTRLAALVSGKPLVSGGEVTLEASRDAKTGKVTMAVSALRKANPRSITLQTPTRDKVMGRLLLATSAASRTGCSTVAAVGKDYSISVWAAGGGVAQRFSKGFAGPDVTLGSEAVRKASAACDSRIWFFCAEDAIPWGLTFDLAMASRATPPDGGAALRATEIALLLEAPVAGRKLPDDQEK